MSDTTNAGISTAADGSSYIPASKRPDGTTRKAIRVRPGFTPQEDVKTYKNRNAEAWKNRGGGGVPGVDDISPSTDAAETKSKNAKRREAARKKQAETTTLDGDDLASDMGKVDLLAGQVLEHAIKHDADVVNGEDHDAAELERQKKIRNLLKKLGAVKELKGKKDAGEKLSPDQLMKLSREQEIARDLKKLGYEEINGNLDSRPPNTGTG